MSLANYPLLPNQLHFITVLLAFFHINYTGLEECVPLSSISICHLSLIKQWGYLSCIVFLTEACQWFSLKSVELNSVDAETHVRVCGTCWAILASWAKHERQLGNADLWPPFRLFWNIDHKAEILYLLCFFMHSKDLIVLYIRLAQSRIIMNRSHASVLITGMKPAVLWALCLHIFVPGCVSKSRSRFLI